MIEKFTKTILIISIFFSFNFISLNLIAKEPNWIPIICKKIDDTKKPKIFTKKKKPSYPACLKIAHGKVRQHGRPYKHFDCFVDPESLKTFSDIQKREFKQFIQPICNRSQEKLIYYLMDLAHWRK